MKLIRGTLNVDVNALMTVKQLFLLSQAFPIILRRRNGYEYNSSILSSPVRSPALTQPFPYLFMTFKKLFYIILPCVFTIN